MKIRLPLDQAKRLLKASQEVCPVKTGKLKNSGDIEINNNEITVTYTEDYFNFVHEDPKSSGYKFLENTADKLRSELVKEYTQDALEDIKKSIRGR